MPQGAPAQNFVHLNKSTTVRSYADRSYGGATRDTRGRLPNRAPAAIRAGLRALSLLSPRLALPLARRLFLTPPSYKAASREMWWETEAEPLRLTVRVPTGEKQLAAWRWGAPGPTVLLFHGWGGRALQLGAFAAPLVEAGFRVMAVDLPAHGQTSRGATSLTETADVIGALIDRVKTTEAAGLHAIIAHSFGCAATTLALARYQPEQRAPRVVFLAPPSDLDLILSRFSELSGFTSEVIDRLRQDLERRFDLRWRLVHPRNLAASLFQPLLVIHDSHDAETPFTEGRRLAEAWPGASLHVTAGLGHFRLLRDAGVIDQAIAFLSRADPSLLPKSSLLPRSVAA